MEIGLKNAEALLKSKCQEGYLYWVCDGIEHLF
jgi:hypothetical protein